MAGEIERYQDSVRAYEAASEAARSMVKTIKDVTDCFYGDRFASFLGWRFGINDQILPGTQFDKRSNVSLQAWPSAEGMKEVFSAWHASLKNMQAAWHEIPQDRRIGIKAPPARLELR